jgi:hypothetical protein
MFARSSQDSVLLYTLTAINIIDIKAATNFSGKTKRVIASIQGEPRLSLAIYRQ